MNNFAESNGIYGMTQVQALDFVFRLLAEILGDNRQRPAVGQTEDNAAPQVVIGSAVAAPTACGC